ncbi:FtsP/CotA-like multicopper oxidase with cupredoxin domain [Caldalkalibacillus uzonensis]|uniref:FtsP/CotA-like multicopper oxidase with cupredoxin domain n=1 Tax=Caldalkalibacillus uzonensis TaxID=353224 RepID=A0ABU0CRK1_9BACI|nr:multicopper oxidase family protein [Caldalkalibacillus uzonensis]MDQ0339058.1 FtsP/CotA-like multicopper oxidase with cupredoxin domain [Caldalkalibacillus uzonensis]
MNTFLKATLITIGLIIVLVGCSVPIADDAKQVSHDPEEKTHEDSIKEEDGKVVINLKATETQWMFNDELMEDIWSYNGSLPGKEIRVREGDHVVVRFNNELDVPTAVHFHGVPVPNEMDGVPGITQNAVMPGEEFVYEFVADAPGTYWYHSHQDGANQVEKGLYGAFIVEPKDQPDYDLDQVIMIDDWSSVGMVHVEMEHGEMEHGDHGNMDHNGMHHGEDNGEGHMGHGKRDHGMHQDEMSHDEMMKMMYDTLLINGKAGQAIEPIKVQEGDMVKLRFVNTGLFTQVITIPGHEFKVTHYDGQEVNQPEWISGQAIRIAPAERFDIELSMNQPGAWDIRVYAERNPDQLQVIIPLIYDGYESETVVAADDFETFFDLTAYGAPLEIELGDVTKEYNMILGSDDGGETFTINGKQMNTEEVDGHEVYDVQQGDVVKMTIVNKTDVDHPMHLHGHFFYVTSRNGELVSGSPVKKETLNVRPNETYEIVFVADNPGNWMFHCHELHHASAGMVAKVQYTDYESNFTPDPHIPNKPE